MQFLFLGTGTSSGVPVIACDCHTCSSDDPRDHRTRTGAAVRWTDPDGQDRLALLDTTPDLRAQALRHRLNRCDAVFYTHNHVDHTFGLDEVRRFNAVMQAPIDVFADARTLDHLRRVYTHVFEREKNVNDSFVARLIAHQIGPAQSVDFHGLRFTPIPLLHGRLPILGYRIEPSEPSPTSSDIFPLAYCTDVSAVPPEAWPHLKDLRTLVLSALRHRHHPTHLTFDQALHVADEVSAQRTFFIHMSHDARHAELESMLPDNVRPAFDGLELA